jgi:hypothetical protein
MPDEAKPRLLEQVLGGVARVRQPRQKVEQPDVEQLVHLVEGFFVALPQAFDQTQFQLPVHSVFNALGTES